MSDTLKENGLLPCPFCGCDAKIDIKGYVYCVNDSCGVNAYADGSIRNAAKIWNNRVESVVAQAAEAMRASAQHYHLYANGLEKTAKQAEDYIDKYRALKDACVNLVIERDELRRIVNEQNADLEAYRRAYPNASEWDNE